MVGIARMGCIIGILISFLVTALFGPLPLLIVGSLGGALTVMTITASAMARGGGAARREKAERLQASGLDVEVKRRRTSDDAPPAEPRRLPSFAGQTTFYVPIAAALAIWLVFWLLSKGK